MGNFKGWDSAAVERLVKKQPVKGAPVPVKPELYIGIDPGIKNTGIALWHPKTKLLQLHLKDFWGTIELLFDKINHFSDTTKVTVIMEAPQFNSPTFNRDIEKQRVQDTISQHVGENKAVAKLYAIWIEAYDVELILKKPDGNSLTKLSHEQFVKITGYQGKTNSHNRDAACLLLGYM